MFGWRFAHRSLLKEWGYRKLDHGQEVFCLGRFRFRRG